MSTMMEPEGDAYELMEVIAGHFREQKERCKLKRGLPDDITAVCIPECSMDLALLITRKFEISLRPGVER